MKVSNTTLIQLIYKSQQSIQLLLTSEAGVPGALCPDRLQQNEWASGHTCLLWCNPAPQRGAFPGI